MVTKTGKHHWQYGFTTYDAKTGEIIWNTDKTVVTTNDFKEYKHRSIDRYAKAGVRIEFRNEIDLDA